MTTAASNPSRAVLVIDGTGRGHAICDLFVRSRHDVVVYYGPGSTALEAERIVVVPEISLDDPRTALDFLRSQPVDLVFVSNIDALSKGYADVLRAHGYATIGPSKAAAELEASKERGKRFCMDHGLPTARYRSFTDPAPAKAYARSLPYRCVVKVDGLCKNGDGSVVCETIEQAEASIDAFSAQLGEDFRVVVEERLYGPEISVFALLDGSGYLMFPTAMDFKRTLEGDRGVNCDGMGSVAPHPLQSPALEAEIRSVLLEPLMFGLERDHLWFTGFIYIGAMLTERGLRVIEINARFGDSEAEVVLPSVHNDFYDLCGAVLRGDVAQHRLVADGFVRCSVALTQGCVDPNGSSEAPGWPFGAFEAGQVVHGLQRVEPEEATVFYANVRRDDSGAVVTCGGRVLHVVGRGRVFEEARQRAYRQIGHLSFLGMRFRSDIGAKLREKGWRGRHDVASRVEELALATDRAVGGARARRSVIESILYAFVAGEATQEAAKTTIAQLSGASESEVAALGTVLESYRLPERVAVRPIELM